MQGKWWITGLMVAALAGCASDEEREDPKTPYAWEEGDYYTPEEAAARAPSDGPGQGATRPEIRPGIEQDSPFAGRDGDEDLFLYPEGTGKTMTDYEDR